MFVQWAPPPPAAHLLLGQFTKPLLPPAVPHSHHDGEDQLHPAPFVPEMGNALGAAPLLPKARSARFEVRTYG
jgi:hypothetical protein